MVKCKLSVKGFEMTTSIGGGKNLHLLVHEPESSCWVEAGDEVFGGRKQRGQNHNKWTCPLYPKQPQNLENTGNLGCLSAN
jgi:hypothetical protein